jgi:hypothetical protein
MTRFPPSTGSASRRKKLFRVEDGRIGIRRSRPLGGFVALRLIRFVFRGAFERWRRDRMLAFVRERDLSPLRQKPSIPMTPLRPIGAAQSGSSTSTSSSTSSNLMLRFVFDSDGDTDPDTDACGKSSRPGASKFLLVSARHVADGETARARERRRVGRILALPPQGTEWRRPRRPFPKPHPTAMRTSPPRSHALWGAMPCGRSVSPPLCARTHFLHGGMDWGRYRAEAQGR